MVGSTAIGTRPGERPRRKTRPWTQSNGAGRDGYATRIAAIVAALGAVRVEVKSRRMRDLTRKIRAALAITRRS